MFTLTLLGITKQNLNGSQAKKLTHFTLQQSQTQQQSPHTKQTESTSQEQTAQQPAFQYSILKVKQRNQTQAQEAVLKQKTAQLLMKLLPVEMKITEILTEALPVEMKITKITEILMKTLPAETKTVILALRKLSSIKI